MQTKKVSNMQVTSQKIYIKKYKAKIIFQNLTLKL